MNVLCFWSNHKVFVTEHWIALFMLCTVLSPYFTYKLPAATQNAHVYLLNTLCTGSQGNAPMVMKYTQKSTIRLSKNTKPNSAAILELSWSWWQPHQLPHPFCKSHESCKEQHLSCFSNLHNCKPLCSSHPHQLLFNAPPDLISVIALAKYSSSSFDYSRLDWNPNNYAKLAEHRRHVCVHKSIFN